MDLGKMLEDAIVGLTPLDCRSRVQKWLGPDRIGGDVDLTAAAEAFLAKVKDDAFKAAWVLMDHIDDPLCDVNGLLWRAEALRKALPPRLNSGPVPRRSPGTRIDVGGAGTAPTDHTGPVLFYGHVE